MTAEQLAQALGQLNIDRRDVGPGGWVSRPCPACEAGTGSRRFSMRVNAQTGAYTCFRCQASSRVEDGGCDLLTFLQHPTAPELRANRGRQDDLPPLTEDLVGRYHSFLLGSPALLADLERLRGWTKETVEALGIGWDGTHLWLPIRSVGGELVNCRLYDPFRRSPAKSLHYRHDATRHTAVWVPGGLKSLQEQGEVWWFEGEPDAILAYQLGLPAAAITGGSGTWTPEVLVVMEGRRAVLCYDMDAAGRRGARAIAQRLRVAQIQVANLEFEVRKENGKDFSDVIMGDKRPVDYFRNLAKAMWEGRQADPEQLPVEVPLGQGVPGEDLLVTGHILGAHTTPQLVPETVQVQCRMSWQPDGACQTCPVQRQQGDMRIALEPKDPLVLTLAAQPTFEQARTLKMIARVPERCPQARVAVGQYFMLEHCKLIPPMVHRAGGSNLMRSAVLVTQADGTTHRLTPNQAYAFSGRIVPAPRSSEWTLQAWAAVAAADDVDGFNLTPQLVDHLSTLQPENWSPEAIVDALRQEERSISRHVTNVYGRDLLIRAIDLVYHSILQFDFRGQSLTRGWLSLGVVGETRTGKTETLQAMTRHLGLGQLVRDPANITFAGLIGGLQQVGTGDKSWVVSWGVIPTNDRGLCVIDEVSSLTVDDIAKMSGVRSSGIAEIIKIRSASTPARTRLIMSGNPRGHGAMLDHFATPAEAFRDLIGMPEDVARFDFAMAVAANLDKAKEDQRLGSQPPPITAQLRRALVLWAWSRRPHQVVWEPEAETLVTQLATRMVADYDRRIPLVEPSEQDLKVARVAVALAARTFSHPEGDPSVVLVRQAHVLVAVATMRDMYDGDLAYQHFSQFSRRQELQPEQVLKRIAVLTKDLASFARALLLTSIVDIRTISMMTGIDQDLARDLVAFFVATGAAVPMPGSRQKALGWSPGMIRFLREIEQRPPVVPEGADAW